MVASWVAGSFTAGTLFLCLACLALVVQVLLGRYSLAVSAVLVDGTNRLVEEDLQRLLYEARSIEHFSDEHFLDDLQIVRSEQARLTEGADVIGLILGTSLRLGVTGVITMLATPWLLILPFAAVGAYFCARRRDAVVGSAQRAAAEHARVSGELATIGMDENHTDELLLSRGRGVPPGSAPRSCGGLGDHAEHRPVEHRPVWSGSDDRGACRRNSRSDSGARGRHYRPVDNLRLADAALHDNRTGQRHGTLPGVVRGFDPSRQVARARTHSVAH